MTRWTRGQAEVEQALRTRELAKITGAAADGEPLLAKADKTLGSARELLEADPDSAYVLAYDAARYAATALLAHQGLRPTSSGGHYVVEKVLRAQFGEGFKRFGTLRRRRNELEYPSQPGDETDAGEAAKAVEVAGEILAAVEKLLPTLGLFS